MFINKIRWSRIGAIGNNPYAKLSIIAPIIAPLALYTENVAAFINQNFYVEISTSGMPWLYFSLLSLSAAQFCYNGWGPNEVKEYKSRADFAANGGADLLPSDWERLAATIINSHITQESSLLPILRQIDIYEFPNGMDQGQRERAAAVFDYIKENRGIDRKQVNPLREVLLRELPQIRALGFTDKRRKKLLRILNLVRGRIAGRTVVEVESDLKELKARWYDFVNESQPLRRVATAAFYLIGLSFFLWNVPRSIIENVVRLWPW